MKLPAALPAPFYQLTNLHTVEYCPHRLCVWCKGVATAPPQNGTPWLNEITKTWFFVWIFAANGESSCVPKCHPTAFWSSAKETQGAFVVLCCDPNPGTGLTWPDLARWHYTQGHGTWANGGNALPESASKRARTSNVWDFPRGDLFLIYFITLAARCTTAECAGWRMLLTCWVVCKPHKQSRGISLWEDRW